MCAAHPGAPYSGFALDYPPAARAWFATGAALGFGATVKVYSAVLLLAKSAGHELAVVSAATTLELDGPLPHALGLVVKAAVLIAVAAGAWLTARARPWPRRVPAAMFATLALAVGLGNVFSPQYLLCLVGLGSAAACAACSPVRRPVLLLLPARALFVLLPRLLELEPPAPPAEQRGAGSPRRGSRPAPPGARSGCRRGHLWHQRHPVGVGDSGRRLLPRRFCHGGHDAA